MKENQGDQITAKRVRLLQEGDRGKGPVIYWMSRDQRVHDNWALVFAQNLALRHRKGLMAVFCLTTDFLGANLRHYLFLLKGLQEQVPEFAAFNIGFHLLEGDPGKTLPKFLARHEAGALVTDFDPLRLKKSWKEKIAGSIHIPFYVVDAHNIVPVWQASSKKEFAAHTLRPKIHKALPEYLSDFPRLAKHPYPSEKQDSPFAFQAVAEGIKDRSVPEVSWCIPGAKAGLAALRSFIRNRLVRYSEDRNDPCRNGQSNLSPYLHFGQLAPQRVALEISSADVPEAVKAAFLEELIVRRELADNFCHYEPAYDRFGGFHAWARKTLDEHRQDKRAFLYSAEEFDQGRTHDELWNACQLDLVESGKLHGYLRMYWAKKILEWSASPEEALATAIFLNDRYSIDGRDPNGYTGIAWSIGGVHDRAWAERDIFGKIRYMSYQGCRRKFDVNRYIENVTAKNTGSC
jgi:deoxyribodipyrimidine photo-lyase